MSDKQHLAFHLAVLDALSLLATATDSPRALEVVEKLRVLRDETAKTLADWYPPEPPKPGDPEKCAEMRKYQPSTNSC